MSAQFSNFCPEDTAHRVYIFDFRVFLLAQARAARFGNSQAARVAEIPGQRVVGLGRELESGPRGARGKIQTRRSAHLFHFLRSA